MLPETRLENRQRRVGRPTRGVEIRAYVGEVFEGEMRVKTAGRKKA